MNPLELLNMNFYYYQPMRSNNSTLQVLVVFYLFFQLVNVNLVYAKSKQIIDIAYLTQEQIAPPQLSNAEPFIKNKGIIGAELGIDDDNTTGEFTGQQFNLKKFIVPLDGNITDTFNKAISHHFQYVIVNLPATQLTQLADLPATKDLLLLDVATMDDALRNEQCRNNVLHLLPSRAMRADALAQYMMKKRWDKWFLVVGSTQEDRLFAEAIRRAAKRFGMKIIADKTWEHTFDARRTEQSDVAVFTQIDEAYDNCVVMTS